MKQLSKKIKKTNKQTANNKSWREYFRSDKAILTICISIAFVFWLIIKLSYLYRTSIVIPIVYELKPEMTFKVPPPTKCEVDVRATGWNLMTMQKSQILLTEDKIQQHTLISGQDLQQEVQKMFGSNIQIYDIIPNVIELFVDSLIEKQVPIISNIDIKTLPQYRLLGQPNFVPNTLTVTGPKSILDTMTSWQTEHQEIDSVSISMRRVVPLRIHENLQVSTHVKEVEMHVEVQQLTEKKITLPISTNKHLQQDSFIFALIPNQVTITCLVGLQDYNKLQASDFEVEVELPELTKLKKSADKATQVDMLKVRIKKKPIYADVSNIEPKSVQYLIRKIQD